MTIKKILYVVFICLGGTLFIVKLANFIFAVKLAWLYAITVIGLAIWLVYGFIKSRHQQNSARQ